MHVIIGVSPHALDKFSDLKRTSEVERSAGEMFVPGVLLQALT